MNKQVVKTSSSNPRLSISRIGGDLHIFGWENPEINIEGGLIEELRMGEEGELLKIQSGSDCRIYLPMGASAQIERVGSDATIERMNGPIMIGRVGGDITLRSVGPFAAEHIGSDFAADDVRGDLVVKKVSGSFRGRNISGAVHVDHVGSDFHLENAGGPVTVAASGDVRLTLSQMAPGAYSIRAGSDLALRIPPNMDVKVSMECGSNRITIRTPEVTDVLHTRWYTLTLGQGANEIFLKSGGGMLFSSHPADQVPTSGPSIKLERELADLGSRIAQQISDDLRATNLSARIGAEMSQRMSQVTQQAMLKAEERINEAMRRMERKMGARSSAPGVIIPPVPPVPAVRPWEKPADTQETNTQVAAPEPPEASAAPVEVPAPVEEPVAQPDDQASRVTDDERLLILQMVENKKITVEEAEQLLEAIEEIADEEQG